MSDEKREVVYYRLNRYGQWVRCDGSSESFGSDGKPLVVPKEQLPAPREGFYVNVDGVTAHIQGDPNMSDQEFGLLEKMIRAAIKMVESENKDDDHEASDRHE